MTVLTQPSPYPTAKLTVFVFQDDFPLNGEHDAGGGVDVLSPNEAGLGGFKITLFDDAGGTGDATGQPTYDMFNMPLTNSLAGTRDPITGLDACPISTQVTANVQQSGATATPAQCAADPTLKGCQRGIVGMIVTCPRYESDGTTLSPLAGQAVVNNLYQGRYGVVATPNADRIAAGEEWLQTNTLDGQKAHDSFMRIGEPAYFQEFGPAGYHVTIGFANPKIINERRSNAQHTGLCDPVAGGGGGLTCNNEVTGHVTTARMSRPPDQRTYGSGSRDSYSFTQCYASLGDPDGADFAFAKCDADGNFDFTNIPAGDWKLTIFDQWNDQIVDGISSPVALAGASGAVKDLGEIASHQWQADIYTRTFLDQNGDGVSQDAEPGLPLVSTNIRFRDGSFSNFNSTDLNGFAGFNEVFPLFSWYTIETDTTRYKSMATHVVYDAGGPTDGTPGGGTSAIGHFMANTVEPAAVALPPALRVPGARYCASADCPAGDTAGGSTGRVDPPFWFGSYGWQGFAGQNSFLEFGEEAVRSGRERRNPRPRGVRLDPALRRSAAAPAALLGAARPARPGEPLQGGLRGRRRHPDPDPHRPHRDQQLRRLGAGLPVRWRAQHELPGPADGHGSSRPGSLLLRAAEPAELPQLVQLPARRARGDPAAQQLPVQVLRRHAQLEPAAAGPVRWHVQLPQRHQPRSRRTESQRARTARPAPRTPTRPIPIGSAPRCCRPASTWSRWWCPRATSS